MELKLKQETLTYFEAAAETPFSFETTQEAIVPDYCADVARIVDTTGCVLLHNKELLPDGRLELNGVIKATVLFVPEGSKEVCALHLSLPMHSYFEGRNLAGCANYSATVRLGAIDSRLLNPRKLLTRAETIVEVCAYENKAISLCTGVEEGEALGLEMLSDSAETTVITAVAEREFTYVDELSLSASRPAISEILHSRTSLTPAECRVVGNKLVVKGIVRGELLYKDTAGELGTVSQEFLFSQIMESEATDESALVRCAFDLTGYEYLIGSESSSEDGHCVTMKLRIRSHVQVLEVKKLSFLSDMYSTCKELKLERQTMLLTEDARSFVKKQSLRELLTTAVSVKDVVYATADCGSCRCQSGESGSFVEANVRIRCLYLDENDALLPGEKEITIKAETELDSTASPRICVQCAGEVSASPAPDGIDTRFTLEFALETGRKLSKTCVAKAEAEEPKEGGERKPSLVLRKFDRGMRLWDIAKLYRTTAADILAANELESETAIPYDQLLLIPRRK